MTHEELNNFCKDLKATSYVMQWGNSHVWKVGGKVFVIGGWGDDYPAITFKTSEMGYEILKETKGYRPAPYLASRGMKWIQRFQETGEDARIIKDHIRHSYQLVAMGLSKKKRAELGIEF